MIKLIVSDMDGTLLDEQKKLPKEFSKMLTKLKEQEIQFVVGSGRSYPILRKDFSSYINDLYFICDNGSIILKQDKEEYSTTFSKKLVMEIIQACDSISGIMPVLCGKKSAYHVLCSDQQRGALRSYYNQERILEHLWEIEKIEDEILKFAIYDEKGGENNCYPILEKAFGNRCNVVVSGPHWVDIMKPGVSKGTAVAFLQQKLGISKEETMAFGDFYNDVEMLQQAKYSFVMENAEEKMKQYGNFIAPKNTENGVMKMIDQFVFGKRAEE